MFKKVVSVMTDTIVEDVCISKQIDNVVPRLLYIFAMSIDIKCLIL